MHYEINIAKAGQHLFATHERSVQTEYQLEKLLRIMQDKFPESEGYNLTVTKWSNSARHVSIQAFFEEQEAERKRKREHQVARGV